MALEDSIEDEFIGKRVNVEAQVYGGGLGYNASHNFIQLYWGHYKGVKSIAGHDVILLENYAYNNRASIMTSEKSTPNTMVFGKMLMIPWQHILSIGLWDEKKEHDTK